jgi:predicted cupin superfamily sugar epimerase
MELTTAGLIEQLNLVQHPEGGWYRETYRSNEMIPAQCLPERFDEDRSFCTAIYFLLGKNEISALHRIKSDEIWHYHAGTALTVHLFLEQGEHRAIKIGQDLVAGETYQFVVPAGCWFGAEVTGEGDYSLVGCSVAPGFDFADFEMGSRDSLLKQFPEHTEIIRRMCVSRV